MPPKEPTLGVAVNMRDAWPDDRLIDSSCMERVANAVESFITIPKLNEALENACITITVLKREDFPPQLAEKYQAIFDRFLSDLQKYEPEGLAKFLDSHPEYQFLRFGEFPGVRKRWLKEQIWSLYRSAVAYNEDALYNQIKRAKSKHGRR